MDTSQISPHRVLFIAPFLFPVQFSMILRRSASKSLASPSHLNAAVLTSRKRDMEEAIELKKQILNVVSDTNAVVDGDCDSLKVKKIVENKDKQHTSYTSNPKKREARNTKNAKASKQKVEVTNSFRPLSADRFPELDSKKIKIHTLILGTHPSIASLTQEQYYGHPLNAFWWIAGDCLGFRRSSGISPSTGEPYQLTSFLRHGPDRILNYEEQIRLLCRHGFALWDVVGSCERPGSLDQDIRNETANDVRGFCERHRSVRRIVLANGGTGSQMFVKHFQPWWMSGQLRAAENEESQRVFHKFNKYAEAWDMKQGMDDGQGKAPIVVISAISVSPAAAKYTYEEKRDFWEKHVFEPGLRDFEQQRRS